MLDDDRKLSVSYLVSGRDPDCANAFYSISYTYSRALKIPSRTDRAELYASCSCFEHRVREKCRARTRGNVGGARALHSVPSGASPEVERVFLERERQADTSGISQSRGPEAGRRSSSGFGLRS